MGAGLAGGLAGGAGDSFCAPGRVGAEGTAGFEVDFTVSTGGCDLPETWGSEAGTVSVLTERVAGAAKTKNE